MYDCAKPQNTRTSHYVVTVCGLAQSYTACTAHVILL